MKFVDFKRAHGNSDIWINREAVVGIGVSYEGKTIIYTTAQSKEGNWAIAVEGELQDVKRKIEDA